MRRLWGVPAAAEFQEPHHGEVQVQRQAVRALLEVPASPLWLNTFDCSKSALILCATERKMMASASSGMG